MKSKRRFSGLFLIAPIVVAMALLWYYRALWQTPSNLSLVDMPDEEFADNPSLTLPQNPDLLDTELTAQGYLSLLEQMREPETLLWEGLITVREGQSSRSFNAAYRKDGADFASELMEYGSVRRGLSRKGGALTLMQDEQGEAVAAFAPVNDYTVLV